MLFCQRFTPLKFLSTKSSKTWNIAPDSNVLCKQHRMNVTLFWNSMTGYVISIYLFFLVIFGELWRIAVSKFRKFQNEYLKRTQLQKTRCWAMTNTLCTTGKSWEMVSYQLTIPKMPVSWVTAVWPSARSKRCHWVSISRLLSRARPGGGRLDTHPPKVFRE